MRTHHEIFPTDFDAEYCAAMGHLAEVFRSLREEAVLTQEELAERAGLSVRTISDIERGLRKRLYRDTAERLGVALGLTDPTLAEFVDLARGRGTDLKRELDQEFRRRFVAWHVDRLSMIADHFGSEELWYEALDADEPNLTVALRWAEEAGDTEGLLQLCAGLWRYWQARGHLASGRGWLERGLASSPPASSAARATALWALAWLAYQQGDDECAASCADELDRVAEGALGRRNAATVRGIVALTRDDVDAALRNLEEALVLARTLDQPWILATSLLNVGIAQIGAGQTDASRAVIGEALRLYADLDDERFRARSLGYLGLAALVDGDADRGEALFAQSLAVFDELGEGKGIAEGLSGLATAATMRDLATRAAQLAGAAERVRETFAGRAMPVEGRLTAAWLARAEATVGSERWREAWTSGRAMRLEEAIGLALTGH